MKANLQRNGEGTAIWDDKQENVPQGVQRHTHVLSHTRQGRLLSSLHSAVGIIKREMPVIYYKPRLNDLN